MVFCQTRKLAQEYTYRYPAAAHSWFVDDTDAAPVLEPSAQPSNPDVRALGQGQRLGGVGSRSGRRRDPACLA